MDTEKEKTFKILFEKHYQQLYQHAFGFMKDEETAKDIVNDVFLFFWENFDRFSNPAVYLSLLYTLVRNHCIDHLRHDDVKDRYIQYLKFAFTEEDIDYYTQYQELLDEAFKRLNALPKQAREVVYACLVEGKSYKEVAEQMGISPNTVRNHIVQSLSKRPSSGDACQDAPSLVLVGSRGCHNCLIDGFLFPIYIYGKERTTEKVVVYTAIPEQTDVVLQTAGGRSLSLSSQEAIQELGEIEAIEIEKDGINYPSTPSKDKTVEMHTLSTPQGKNFKVVLSDGTEVWMNAERPMQPDLTSRQKSADGGYHGPH